jgi:hypothetical protein
MSSYCPDGTTFSTKKAAEAANSESGYYKKLTWQQRLLVANYLNSIKYNYPENEPPKLDRTAFRAYSKKEQDKSEL